MSYVKHVLQPGEQITRMASIHWIVYWPGVLILALSIVVFVYSRNAFIGNAFALYTGYVFTAALLVIGLFFLLVEWFKWWTTEIAVTNRRIIYKTGFIRRDTNEMHMDKVESVKVDQSILGRVLNYGAITVLGTGSGLETIKSVAAPIELRNHITGA